MVYSVLLLARNLRLRLNTISPSRTRIHRPWEREVVKPQRLHTRALAAEQYLSSTRPCPLQIGGLPGRSHTDYPSSSRRRWDHKGCNVQQTQDRRKVPVIIGPTY
ncbi:hypothetical protein PAXRUDRAFT_299736 [Paxillus rubicundulus Ve08.2h10]|uniref:Uncharacterized protein n=1 Tax=Paxillus rubicundulus Ve08.2h10 TaxID=930991 RepID=A0A0D0DSM9_9AGAM|nr:hypothetical protein PAXRUDRAFT_299736 [Paxillus rubicundulus Ve08.2h10]